MKTLILLLTILSVSAFAADSPYTLELRPMEKYTARSSSGQVIAITNIHFADATNIPARHYPIPGEPGATAWAVTNLPPAELTNAVNALVSSGKFCAVRGHTWTERTISSVYASNPPIPVYAERCAICGKWIRFTISSTETIHEQP